MRPASPRQRRALEALLRGPQSRRELDRIIGCTNAPEAVFYLRRLGMSIPCRLLRVRDRDGRPCCYGVYSLTPADRRLAQAMLRMKEA